MNSDCKPEGGVSSKAHLQKLTSEEVNVRESRSRESRSPRAGHRTSRRRSPRSYAERRARCQMPTLAVAGHEKELASD